MFRFELVTRLRWHRKVSIFESFARFPRLPTDLDGAMQELLSRFRWEPIAEPLVLGTRRRFGRGCFHLKPGLSMCKIVLRASFRLHPGDVQCLRVNIYLRILQTGKRMNISSYSNSSLLKASSPSTLRPDHLEVRWKSWEVVHVLFTQSSVSCRTSTGGASRR